MALKRAERLEGVRPQLAAVVRAAAQACDFDILVVEGVRTAERQAMLYSQGRTAPGKIVTWTLKSAHIDGRAVDLAPLADNGSIDWNDTKRFDAIARAMFAAAERLGAQHIRWGADWDGDGNARERGESDSPHFEIPA